MEHQHNEPRDVDRINEVPKTRWRYLPIIALAFGFLAMLCFLFSPFPLHFAIVTIIMGVISLCKGKQQIGTAGFVLSIIAIVWALALVGLFLWISRLMALGLFP